MNKKIKPEVYESPQVIALALSVSECFAASNQSNIIDNLQNWAEWEPVEGN